MLAKEKGSIREAQDWFWGLPGREKVAREGVPRARARVSTPELAITLRGESVSGHPVARGGPERPEHHPEGF